ncbi:MAG TPA: DUF5668 domain-containing protein [Candidatus Dormibacteraeota bacterium]|nr:DUF5668 domain-containing protein [Candidatus Dormibacteraeota bacterium]
MENNLYRRSRSSSGAVLGVILVIAGIIFLASQYLPFDLAQLGWPMFVIVAGVALLAVGVSSRSLAGLAVPGSIVTVTGLILAVQNTYGLWATWSYAWALVFPGAVGLGITLMGLTQGNRVAVHRGSRMALVGVALCAIFGIFFEGVLKVGKLDLGPITTVVLPLLVIAVGVAFLVRAAFSRPNA